MEKVYVIVKEDTYLYGYETRCTNLGFSTTKEKANEFIRNYDKFDGEIEDDEDRCILENDGTLTRYIQVMNGERGHRWEYMIWANEITSID